MRYVFKRIIISIAVIFMISFTSNFAQGEVISELTNHSVVPEFKNRVKLYREKVQMTLENLEKESASRIKNAYSAESQKSLEDLLASLKKLSDILDRSLSEYSDVYTLRFKTENPSKEIRQRLTYLETNIRWALEKSILRTFSFLEKFDNKAKAADLNKLVTEVNGYAQSLETGKDIKPALTDLVEKVAPLRTGLFKTLCIMIGKMCLNRPVSEMIDQIRLEPFVLDAKQEWKYTYLDQQGKPSKGFEIPEGSVVILVMNHDTAPLDALTLSTISKKIGAERNLVLTTTGTWPHVQLFNKLGVPNPDKNLLFIQDKSFRDKLLQEFRNNEKTISFSIFPEGAMPGWLAPLPLSAKPGAFEIAAKAAQDLQGKKDVYLIEVKSNFISSVINRSSPQVEIKVFDPVQVPALEPKDQKNWIEDRRVRFENLANKDRGMVVDMQQIEKVPNGWVYYANSYNESDVKNHDNKSCKHYYGNH